VVLGLAISMPLLAPLLVHHNPAVATWLQRNARWLGVALGELPPVYPQPLLIAAALAVILLALAAVVLHRAGSRSVHEPTAIVGMPVANHGPVDLLLATGSEARTWRRVAVVLGCSWLALVLVMSAKRVESPSSHWVIVAWLGCFVVAWLVALLVDRRFRVAGGPAAVSRRHVLLLLALVSVISIWLASDLDSWRYSCIGDEWGVYERAESYAHGNLLDAENYLGGVSQGIYRVHAPILSGTQSLVMRVAGINNFGWRLSAVLAASLSLVPFALFAGRILGRGGLVVALVLAATSPVLFAEAHTGYGWGQMRLWTLCVLAALVHTIERRQMRHAVMLGIFCVLCSLISGLAVFVAPLALLWLFVSTVRSGGLSTRSRLRLAGRGWMVLLLAVAVIVFVVGAQLPGWLAPESESMVDKLRLTLWKTSLGPLVAHVLGPDWFDPPLTEIYGPGTFAEIFGLMLVRSLLAPLTFISRTHYVNGHLMDPIGAGLVLIGMVVSLLSRVGRRRSELLWLFFLPAMLLAGAFAPYHEYGDLRITRLHILVPFWAIFAGLGYEAVVRALQPVTGVWSRWLPKAVFALVAGAVVLWNLHAIHVRIPRDEGATSIVLAVREMQLAAPHETVLACLGPWHPMDGLIRKYPGNEKLQFVDDEPFAELIESQELDQDSVFLFPLPLDTPERRELCVSLLQTFTDQLECTALPRAPAPKILKCRPVVPGGERESELWFSGNSSVPLCG
jgi:hypothetical protein